VTRPYVLYSGQTLVLGVISPVYVIRIRTHSTEQWFTLCQLILHFCFDFAVDRVPH
jgi:hypothetical protein